MNTSDFITWISVLIAIWAFANPYHRLKIGFLSFWHKFIFIGLGFTIVFFSIIYPNNLFEIAKHLNQYNLIQRISRFLKSTNINSFLLSLFFASIFSWLLIVKIFFEKKLNLKTDFGIKNSIALIDGIYNEGEKMYSELTKVLDGNIDQIIKIFNINEFIKYKEISPIKNKDESLEINYEGVTSTTYQKIQNKTTIPLKNWFNKPILKNKEKLNAILIIILTDEKFLNYLVTREIGVSLFLKCYKKSTKSINSGNYYWSKELANVQFVREFFKISLQNSKSKFRVYFDKEIESGLIEIVFSDAKIILKYKLLFLVYDWLIEEFDEKLGKPKIEDEFFIQSLEIKLDLLFRFIKKLGHVAQKQKVMTYVGDLIHKISDNLITFLLDYSQKHEDYSFIESNILYKIEELLDDDILVFDGDGSDNHGLLHLYINLTLRISKIAGSNKYMHDFINYFSLGGQYTEDMHKHWGKIKLLLSTNDDYFEQMEIDKMRNCLKNDFDPYVLRVNGSKRGEEINNFLNGLEKT
jgi:hypothetical protein